MSKQVQISVDSCWQWMGSLTKSQLKDLCSYADQLSDGEAPVIQQDDEQQTYFEKVLTEKFIASLHIMKQWLEKPAGNSLILFPISTTQGYFILRLEPMVKEEIES